MYTSTRLERYSAKSTDMTVTSWIRQKIKKISSAFAAASLFRARFYRFSPIHLRECSWSALRLFITFLIDESTAPYVLLFLFYFHPRGVCLLQILSWTPLRKHSRFYTVSRKDYYMRARYGLYHTIYIYIYIYRQAESVSTKTYVLVSREYWCATNIIIIIIIRRSNGALASKNI